MARLPLDELDAIDPDWMCREPASQALGLVGLAGCMGAGKDESGKLLVELARSSGLPVRTDAFAASLKESCRTVFSLTETQLYGTLEQKNAVDPRWGMSARTILQLAGTQGARNVFGSSIWTRSAFARIQPGAVTIFTDVRFPEEFDAIRAAGGKIYLIARNADDPWELGPDPVERRAAKHVSETALIEYTDAFDAIIINDGRERYDDQTLARAALQNAISLLDNPLGLTRII